MTYPTADELCSVPLFAVLSADERQKLARRLSVVDHDAGRTIVAEGARARDFHVLVAGRASVTQGPRQLAYLGPGDFFGEIALAVGGRRTATVTAAEPCRTWVLGRRQFRALSLVHPDVTRSLEVAIRRRLATGG